MTAGALARPQSLGGKRPRGAFPETPLREVVIYELHVGTLTAEGTYAAATERLTYLRNLGVTHIELMPLSAFPGERGWGYDGVYPYAPHRTYGTPEDLYQFVEACHEHGLGVMLDVVYNHFGPDGNYLGHFASYGLVKVLPEVPGATRLHWERKRAFDEVARRFAEG